MVLRRKQLSLIKGSQKCNIDTNLSNNVILHKIYIYNNTRENKTSELKIQNNFYFQ